MRLWPLRVATNYGKETENPPGAVSQELLIVCDGRDLDGLQIMQNVCTALSFGKMQFTMLENNLAHLAGNDPDSLKLFEFLQAEREFQHPHQWVPGTRG